MSGTNLHPQMCRLRTPPFSRSMATSSWNHEPPTGMTSRAPSPSCSTSGSGTVGAAAVTMIPSYGASPGWPLVPSPSTTVTLSYPSSPGQGRDALDAHNVALGPYDLAEHGRLIAGAAPDLQHVVAG